jgi:hypothetical protein
MYLRVAIDLLRSDGVIADMAASPMWRERGGSHA